MRHHKGSITIEAVLVMTLTLLVMLASFGLLFTIYTDIQVEWAVNEVKDKMILDASFGLESLLDRALGEKLSQKNLSNLLKIKTSISYGAHATGQYEWCIKYTYNFASIKKGSEWIVPIQLAIKNDNLRFNSPIVFITTYGEKYHLGTCYHLRKSKYPIERKLAEEKDYSACKNCHPPMTLD